jgi:hypothetical protein
VTAASIDADRGHCLFAEMVEEETSARNYLNSSGLIAMNNPIISPITTPMIVPAASTFFSLVVMSTPQRRGWEKLLLRVGPLGFEPRTYGL